MDRFAHTIGGRVILNVQANTVSSAKEATNMADGAVLIGVMAKDYVNLEDGIQFIRNLHDNGVQVSAGLGDGSADQWDKALQLALHTHSRHLNQIYPAAALSQFVLKNNGAQTIVNAMVRPTGEPGLVQIGTGPLSQSIPAVVPVESAFAMMKEMGITSVKFFPIEGTKKLDELRAVARAAAKEGMIVEPTGGITVENVAEIVSVCLEEGVSNVIPHLYGSLKNKETNDLDLQKFTATLNQIQSIFAKGRL